MKDKLYTHSQASDLLATAAKLEAATVESTESRLTLDEVREAAQAAGIDPRYVDAAMHATAGRTLEERWLGVPVTTVRTLIVPGHLDDDAWGRVVAAIRDSFGVQGITESIGNSRRWSHNKNVVTAEPAGADTLVHITFDRAGVTKGMGYTSFAMGGTAIVLATAALLSSPEAGVLLTAGLMATIAVIYGSVSFVLAPLQHRWALKKIDKFANHLTSISGVKPALENLGSLPEQNGHSLLDGNSTFEESAGATRTRLRES